MKERPLLANFRGMLIIMVFVTCLVMAGCGLKGDPIPDNAQDEFAFGELSAEMAMDGVLTFNGKMTGASQNLEYLVLEIQPVDGELCLGCPFLAQEQQRFDSRDIWSDPSGGSFSFVFTPVYPAETYRWRLLARNVYAGLPEIVSEVKVVSRDKVSPNMAWDGGN